MQQRCPNCGSPVAPGQRFCGVCGAQISLSCPQCRITVSPGTRFCPSCGTSLGGGPQPQSGWGQQPQPGWGQQQQPGWGQQPQPGLGQQQPGWGQQPGWAPPAQRPQPSSARPFLVILLIVLLIGLGGLVYWQFGDAIKGVFSSSGGTTTTTDITKPEISKVMATAGVNNARIDWETNELASTQVEYGKSKENTSLSELKDDPTSGTSIGVLPHSVTLTGLEPSTTANRITYYYRVKSKDKAGNEAVSDWKTFETAVPEA